MTADSIFGGAAARKLEAAYLTPDVVEQRRATLQALALRPGERVLDVGSGPGLLSADMAEVVGLAGHVIGIDVSDAMLALGQRRCANIGETGRLSFIKADATALPFPDAAFDAAVSIQVYEYVADLPNALAELYRVLRPGGGPLSWTPTGTPLSGMPTIPSGWAGSLMRGGHGSPTRICPARLVTSSELPGSRSATPRP